MSINQSRGFLYWLARILGDVNVVQKGQNRSVMFEKIGNQTS